MPIPVPAVPQTVLFLLQELHGHVMYSHYQAHIFLLKAMKQYNISIFP